ADYQTYGQSPVSGISYTFNVGKAKIAGIEADLTWRPLSRWLFEARGNYLDTQFTEINAAQTAYIVGDQLDLVPRYQFNLTGQRDFSWLGKHGFVRVDYSQNGPDTSRNRSYGPWYHDESDVIQLLNFRTSLSLKDNLNVGFSAQNLLNDQGFV